jgi:hypothetical protein
VCGSNYSLLVDVAPLCVRVELLIAYQCVRVELFVAGRCVRVELIGSHGKRPVFDLSVVHIAFTASFALRAQHAALAIRRVPPGFAGSAWRPTHLHNGSIRVGRRAADRRSALAAPLYPGKHTAAACSRSERRRREQRTAAAAARAKRAKRPLAALGPTIRRRHRPRRSEATP